MARSIARRAFGVLLALPLLGAAAPLVEPSTGVQFTEEQEAGGKAFECLGTGVRKVFFVKAYAVAFCLEGDKADQIVDGYLAKAHAGESGPGLAKALKADGDFYRQLGQDAAADRLVVMKVTRDLSREQLSSAFRDSLSKVLPAPKVEKLIATIPSDVQKGQTVRIWSEGEELTIDIAGQRRTLADAEIVKQIWSVWLSGESVTPALRTSIAERAAKR